MKPVTVSPLENPQFKWNGYITEATPENHLLLTIERNDQTAHVFAFMQFGQPFSLIIDDKEWSMLFSGSNEKGYHFR